MEAMDAKIELIYQIAEKHLTVTLPKRDFGVPVIIEVVGKISKELATFRDEQKTEVIISTLNRLYKSDLLKAHLSKLPEPVRNKLDNFMTNAMPHFVDMIDDFLVPSGALAKIRTSLDAFFGRFGCTFSSCMFKTTVCVRGTKAAIADGKVTVDEVKQIVADVKTADLPAAEGKTTEPDSTSQSTELPTVTPSAPAESETRPPEVTSEKDATQ